MRSENQQNMFALIEQKPQEQTAKEFCAAKGISEATYYYWLKKARQITKVVGSHFVPLQFGPSDRLALATIQLPSGSIISVYDLQVFSFMQPYL